MSELRKKTQKRNGHRIFVRKVMNSVKELLDDPSTQSISKSQLENHKAVLSKQQGTIEQLDNEIADLVDENNIEEEVVETCDFDAAVQEIICQIDSILSSDNTVVQVNVETSQPIETSEAQQAQQVVEPQPAITNTSKGVKLPKLSLQRFDGNPTKWVSFWDSFSSAIHENKELNNIAKFQYLRSLLDGPAADAIEGLPLTGANYNEAVKLLQDRFGHKQVIISNHLDVLMKLPAVNGNKDLKGLRQLYDKTESTVRSLQGIGIQPQSYGTLLTPIIMSKISQDLRLIVCRNLADEWDLNNLLNNLKEEVRLRERCALASVDEQREERRSVNNYGKQFPTTVTEKRQPTTAAVLHSGSSPAGQSSYGSSTTGPWCTFCKGSHPSSKCSIVTEPAARKRILRQKGKCFICLKGGHISRDCKSEIKCFRCQGRHHMSVCMGENQQSRSQQGNNTSNQGQTVSTNSYFLQDSKNSCVLLQTAMANVSTPSGHSPCQVRVLIDSCSQKSYISTRLRTQLNLTTISKDTVLIKTFGNDEAALKQCDVVQFVVNCPDGLNIFVKAYEVDIICSPLANQTINFAQHHYPHLQNLPLADSSTGNHDLEVDIMIGADYYWSFVQNHVVRGEPSYSPVAIRTRLGYVLSGPVGQLNEATSNVTICHAMKTECVNMEEKCSPLPKTLKTELSKFWDYDTLGVKTGELSECEIYFEKIIFNGNRYEVSLPFKQEHPVIPDNYSLSCSRLHSLLRRLRLNPDILRHYDSVIRDQLATGVIQLVDESESESAGPGSIHYIPHREVLREDKNTTKLRVVYDASAKHKDEASLNECLLPGPSLTPLILDILLRFRLSKIALVGDIEKDS